MRTYELVLVLKATLSEAQRKKLLETIKSWLKTVKVVREEEWGQKPLSYKIKRENNGFYTLLGLESDSPVPSDLEKRILTNEDILRHLLVRKK